MRKKIVRHKQIFSMLLVAAFAIAPFGNLIGTEAYTTVNAETVESAASVTFGETMVNNKAEAILSSTPQDDNWAVFETYEGRSCIVTQFQRNDKNNKNVAITQIPVAVDDDYIGPNDRNIAVKLTFFDRDWDTLHVIYKTAAGGRISHDIVKYASNEWRTATIILRNPKLSNEDIHGSDIVINAAENTLLRDTEYISKVEIVNLDKTYLEPQTLSKTDILHSTEGRALYEIGLFEGFVEDESKKYGLDKPITKEQAAKTVIKLAYEGSAELKNATCTAADVSAEAKPYIGLALDKGIITAKADGSIGADEYVTMQQMLDMFIHVVTGSAPADTLKIAEELKLTKRLEGRDEHSTTGFPIYNVVPGLWTAETANLSRYAYGDDLAAISYNMLYQKAYGSDAKMMTNLYNNKVFTQDAMVATHCGELIYEFYRQTGFNLVESSHVNEDTGVTINTLSLPGLPTTGGYAHNMNMSADGKNIVVCTALDTSSNYGLMAVYNRDTKKTTVLHPEFKESYHYGDMVCASTNEIFYTCADELYCYDMTTGENRFIVKQYFDTDDIWSGVPSVTDDGEYLINYAYDREKRTTLSIDRVNTRTGEMEKIFDKEDVYALKSFRGNYTPHHIGHININPVYKNLYFFILHYAETAPYEIFVFNSDTGETKCVYSDHVKDSGTKDESSSHWVWSEDGEKIHYIKYATSDFVYDLPGVGIMSVDKDGNETASPEVCVNADYSYNHVGVSPGDRYFAGDHTSKWSQPNKRFEAKVVLIDGETGGSRLLANKVGIWSSHPGHLHPLICEDHSTLSFTMTLDNYHLVAAYIDLTTLPERNPDDFKTAYTMLGNGGSEKGVELHYEYYNRAYYSNVAVENGTMGGKNCLVVAPKKKAVFDVIAEYVSPAEREVSIEIEYFDNGTGNIELLYNSTDIQNTPSLRKNKPISFKRTNTNTWLTKKITITDACFNNSGAGNTDIAISAINSSTPVYVRSIFVSKGSSIQDVTVEGSSGLEGVETIKAFSNDATNPITVKGNYTKSATAPDGAECIKLANRQTVSFAIDKSVAAKKKDTVKIAVTYYDLGLGSITIEYNSNKKIKGLPFSQDYMTAKINRTGKNVWTTDIIELTNAQLEGRQADGADFRINSSNSSVPVYIKQVEILTEE